MGSEMCIRDSLWGETEGGGLGARGTHSINTVNFSRTRIIPIPIFLSETPVLLDTSDNLLLRAYVVSAALSRLL